MIDKENIPNGNIEQIFSLHTSALKSLERNHLGNHLNIARIQSSVLIQGWVCVPNKILLTMPEVVSKSVTKAEFLEVGCPGGWKVEGGQRQHHQARHHQQHQHQVGCLLRFKEGIFQFFFYSWLQLQWLQRQLQQHHSHHVLQTSVWKYTADHNDIINNINRSANNININITPIPYC